MNKYLQGTLYRWKLPESYNNEIHQISCQLNISHHIAHLLHQRGYHSLERIRNFLFPLYDEQKYSANNLLGAKRAVERIIEAIKNNEKILIAGDYDVDGMTSTSLLLTALLDCHANVNFYLPHRVKDGYGLSSKIVEKAKKNNYHLIITVDNGISAHEAIKKAEELNIDLIITDHHQPNGFLSNWPVAIVNPHQESCSYSFKELAGVGVIFKVIQLLYEQLQKEIPDKIYELLLLGTIADVVPLIEENRYWVAYSLRKLNNNKSFAFDVLQQNANLSHESITSLDIAFLITPQLNALGRLEDPRDAVSFLVSSDEKTISNTGKKLLELNFTRKQWEKEIFNSVINLIENQEIPSDKEKVIVAIGEWPPGIIGLVASKIMNKYGVPTCIFTRTEEGLLKGSCRSIPECNIFDCLSNIPSHILKNFGGHAHAAGVALQETHLQHFIAELEKQITLCCNKDELQPKISLHLEINELDEIDQKLWSDLQLLQPYGAANEFPICYIPHVYLAQPPVLLKEAHVKLVVQSLQAKKNVIFFNRPDLYSLLSENSGPIALAAKVTCNAWKDKRTIEMIGIDIAFKSH